MCVCECVCVYGAEREGGRVHRGLYLKLLLGPQKRHTAMWLLLVLLIGLCSAFHDYVTSLCRGTHVRRMWSVKSSMLTSEWLVLWMQRGCYFRLPRTQTAVLPQCQQAEVIWAWPSVCGLVVDPVRDQVVSGVASVVENQSLSDIWPTQTERTRSQMNHH